MAKRIQEQSEQDVWISIPKVFMDAPNSMTLPGLVRNALTELQEAGYNGDKVYLAGHSLGGVFLPDIVRSNDAMDTLSKDDILGFIRLGAFQQRNDDDNGGSDKRQLTICGSLDGMVRASRIAEDIQRNVVIKGNSDDVKLHHSTVLVDGMNHFAFLNGQTPFMKKFRDLEAEISQSRASEIVGTTIAEFIDAEISPQKAQSLLRRIDETQQYLRPMMEAMELEGSYHVHVPNFEDEGKAGANFEDQHSQWSANAQDDIAPELLGGYKYTTTKNEIHRSWFINPFAEVPFYHPKVKKTTDEPSSSGCVANYEDARPTTIELQTISELVYDVSDRIFDGGFFSNAPTEIRCKFNTRQSILNACGVDVPFNKDDDEDMASKINAKTIEWALSKVPPAVRERYVRHGVQLKAGKDLPKRSGPSWIWTGLTFRSGIDEDGRECKFLDSPTMNTPLDHPIPSVGGKFYCKLLSPSKALDWIYTDSLRRTPSPLSSLVPIERRQQRRRGRQHTQQPQLSVLSSP